MADGDVVLTRDLSSGRYHKRVRVGNRLDTFEGDNLDQSGAFEVIPAVDPDDEDLWLFCRNCFPEVFAKAEVKA